jgi:hypothetical protein
MATKPSELTVQDCLHSAMYCDDMAAQVDDCDIKFTFAETAREWRLLAQQIDRLNKDRTTPHSAA